jgi:hypothetical protein
MNFLIVDMGLAKCHNVLFRACGFIIQPTSYTNGKQRYTFYLNL